MVKLVAVVGIPFRYAPTSWTYPAIEECRKPTMYIFHTINVTCGKAIRGQRLELDLGSVGWVAKDRPAPTENFWGNSHAKQPSYRDERFNTQTFKSIHQPFQSRAQAKLQPCVLLYIFLGAFQHIEFGNGIIQGLLPIVESHNHLWHNVRAIRLARAA